MLRNEAHTEAAAMHRRRTTVMRVRWVLVHRTLATVAADHGGALGGVRQLRYVLRFRLAEADVAVDLAAAAERAAQTVCVCKLGML